MAAITVDAFIITLLSAVWFPLEKAPIDVHRTEARPPLPPPSKLKEQLLSVTSSVDPQYYSNESVGETVVSLDSSSRSGKENGSSRSIVQLP